MGDVEKEDAKQRILETAIRLFARKSYAATGMRELAREAGVNLAMINYYFGSKRGLLEAIFDVYFERHYGVVRRVIEMEGTLEKRVRWAFRQLTELFRNHPNLVRVAFLELPYDAPEVAEHKADRIRGAMSAVFGSFLVQMQAQSPRPVVPIVFGPGLLGMLIFHFLMRPVLERTYGAPFDDAFYEDYPDRVADLFLYGVLGQPAKGGPEIVVSPLGTE